MITKKVIGEIQSMLREKRYSQRNIASQMGVSRGTVNSIATGRRQVHNAWNDDNLADDLTIPSGTPRRCPLCGAKVFMPCLACQIRAAMNRRKELLKCG